LPAEGQITSARDLAILARAIIYNIPEYEYFVHIPSIRFGRRVTQNFNRLIGRYPGADGMKTGFICASGYNLVASATRNGRRLIAVVLGASSGTMRAVRAAQLLERGFASNSLSWLTPSMGTVNNLAPINASPPNLRDEMCGGKRKRPASDEDESTIAGNSTSTGGETSYSFFAAALQPPSLKPSELMAAGPEASQPVVVYTGPTKSGPALIAANAVDAQKQTAVKRGKKSRVAASKPEAAAGNAKVSVAIDPSTPTKRGRAVAHASAKSDAAAADKPAAKPAKPRPKAAVKPKNSTTGEAGPKTVTAPRT
jgi:D-alanyl-D-alanine carboxypeptidase